MSSPLVRQYRPKIEGLFSKEFQENPHKFWHHVRAISPVAWSDGLNGWLVTNRTGAIEALTKDDFSPDVYERFRPSPLSPSSFELPEAKNLMFRTSLRPLSENRGLRTSLISEIAERLAAGLANQSGIEFVKDYVQPLSRALVRAWLGISDDELTQLSALMHFVAHSTEQDVRDTALAMLRKELLLLLSNKRQTSDGWFFTQVVHNLDSAKFDDADLMAFVGPMILSVVEKSNNRLLTHCMLASCLWPEIQTHIRHGGITTARQAALEGSRWEPITQVVPRRAVRRSSLCEVTIEKDDQVFVILTAACRDPSWHYHPDSFDLERSESSLAFGIGRHGCIGRDLAVEVAAIALTCIFREYSMEIDEAFMPEFVTQFGRSCVRLNLRVSRFSNVDQSKTVERSRL